MRKVLYMIVIMIIALIILEGEAVYAGDPLHMPCNVTMEFIGYDSDGDMIYKCPTCGAITYESSGGTPSYNPTVVSLTAVNNENSVTLKAVIEGGSRYYWSKGAVDAKTGYKNGSYIGTTSRQTINKTVSQNGTWYVYLFGRSELGSKSKSIKVYSVTYDANNDSSAPATQYKAHGYDLTLTSSIPTREDYTFLGWSTDSSATTATYTAGGNFTGNSNTTLYAVWKRSTIPIDTATVTLDQTTYTYDGLEKTPTVTVTIGEGAPLVLGTDYTVSYENNVSAGTATVVVTGLGNYAGSVTKTFTIAKSTIQVRLRDKTTGYDGNLHSITAIVTNPSSGYTITYGTSASSCTLTKLEYKDIGEYTIYCQVTAGENYEVYTGSAKLTIEQVDTIPPTRASGNYANLCR